MNNLLDKILAQFGYSKNKKFQHPRFTSEFYYGKINQIMIGNKLNLCKLLSIPNPIAFHIKSYFNQESYNAKSRGKNIHWSTLLYEGDVMDWDKGERVHMIVDEELIERFRKFLQARFPNEQYLFGVHKYRKIVKKGPYKMNENSN